MNNKQKRRCSPILAGNLVQEKVFECQEYLTSDESRFDSALITDDSSSGCGEDSSQQLSGQAEMDQLNTCMRKLNVEEDPKPAPRSPSNKRNQGSQPNPILPGAMSVKVSENVIVDV